MDINGIINIHRVIKIVQLTQIQMATIKILKQDNANVTVGIIGVLQL
jgi:hypothetical protein